MDIGLGLEVTLAHGIVLANLRRLEDAQATFADLQRRAAAIDEPGPQRLSRLGVAWLASVARLGGHNDEARDLFEQAQLAARREGDLLGEADAVRLAGWSELTAGRIRLALPRLERAAELERQAGVGTRAQTLQSLGWTEFAVGDIDAAQDHLWKAARRFAVAGNPGQVAWCFGILCFTFLQLGRIDQARELATNLIDETRVNGDPWGEALCMVLLAACLSTGERWPRASGWPTRPCAGSTRSPSPGVG